MSETGKGSGLRIMVTLILILVVWFLWPIATQSLRKEDSGNDNVISEITEIIEMATATAPQFNLTGEFDKEFEYVTYIVTNYGADSDYFILEIPQAGKYELDYGLESGEFYLVTSYAGYQLQPGFELRVGVYAEWSEEGEKKDGAWELFYTLTENDFTE